MSNSPRRRFGQGIAVDRDQPHWLHRDYWPLRRIVEGVELFLSQYEDELRGHRAVDLGCGDSPYQPRFARRQIELIRADVEPTDDSVLPIDASGRTPLPDGHAAAVISTQVLEHVTDVADYLAEAHRLLTADGLLLLSTHGSFIHHPHPLDLRRWTGQGLAHDLTQAGFDVIEIRPSIGMLAMSRHMRSIALGGLTRRIPGTGWLRPVIYLSMNALMAMDEWLTPASAMTANPELLFATARKAKGRTG